MLFYFNLLSFKVVSSIIKKNPKKTPVKYLGNKKKKAKIVKLLKFYCNFYKNRIFYIHLNILVKSP